jgi:hypothetical protein
MQAYVKLMLYVPTIQGVLQMNLATQYAKQQLVLELEAA